jgi:Na+/proline symporter
MTMNIHRRLFWGLALMGFMLFFMLSLVIWKIRKVKHMIKSTPDYDVFRKEIRFYEQLGFELQYTGSADSEGNYTFEPNMAWSFMFEVFILFVILSTCTHYWNTKAKVRKLQKQETIDDLNEYL